MLYEVPRSRGVKEFKVWLGGGGVWARINKTQEKRILAYFRNRSIETALPVSKKWRIKFVISDGILV
jgi:hypothetical protein